MRSNHRAHARRRQNIATPAEVETFEPRLLLTTTPGILTPTGTIDLSAQVDGATPEVAVSWEAVDNAVTYDLWVSSRASFELILLRENIAGTSTSIPVTDLAQGGLRIWARANLSDGSQSAWSTGKDVELNVTPTVTGPGDSSPRHLTADNTPVIEWASANEVFRFQIWLTDVTTGTVNRYDVDNLTPLLDADGNQVLDAAGRTIPQEVRSFQIPDADTLQIGRYRAWVRTIDIDGNVSRWSDAYRFDVGPRPQNLSPDAPTFSPAPLLTWDAVDRATHYEVFVSQKPPGGMTTPLFRETVATNSFQIPRTLAAGEYVFWVRAIAQGTDLPTVFGAWSAPSNFGTLVPPTITTTVAADGFVTALRPTIEWTKISGAATYEVLVHKRNSRPPFLETLSNPTSYTFENDLAEGTYTVWIRAIDTRGTFSSYSQPLTFTATGGRTVVTSPSEGEAVTFPTFMWVAVDGAVSYEIFVAHIGVDFTFINVDGITGTSFIANDPANPASSPFPDGDFRVWVRALLADGTFSPWSKPVNFVGGFAQTEEPAEADTLLASLEVQLMPTDDQDVQWTPDDSVPADVDDSEKYAGTEPTDLTESIAPVEAVAQTDAELPADVLTELAKTCVEAEWWRVTDESA